MSNHEGAVLAILRALVEILSEGEPGPDPDVPRARPGSLREAIPELLAREGRPLKATVIARKLGRTNSGHFREVLHALALAGKVVACPGATWGLPAAPGGAPTAGTSP